MHPLETIAVVDDDPIARRLLSTWIEREGWQAVPFPHGAAFLAATEQGARFDAITLDLLMPELDGPAVLAALGERGIDAPVVVFTGHSDVETAVECMRRGAFDLQLKPLDRARAIAALRRAIELGLGPAADAATSSHAPPPYGMVGHSPPLRALIAEIERVAASDTTAFVCGESGTGKELVARAIHLASRRADGPFVAINCGAIPQGLQESELLGHERGAFTGAGQRRRGAFERAQGGTLLLDEVAELTPAAQAALLRVLQERELQRVGGESTVSLDVRVVAATHRDLPTMVQRERFREDLYYRLVVYPLHVPPLRERAEDIPELARTFLRRHTAVMCRTMTLSPAALAELAHYAWPGNVRELDNVMQRLAISAPGPRIEREHLPEHLRRPLPRTQGEPPPPVQLPPRSASEFHRANDMDIASDSHRTSDSYRTVDRAADGREDAAANARTRGADDAGAWTPPGHAAQPPVTAADDANALAAPLEELERAAIFAAIERAHGNLTRAAKALGIGRATLYRRLERWGVDPTTLRAA